MSDDMKSKVELVSIPEIMVRSERKILTQFPQGLSDLMNDSYAAILAAGQQPTGAPILLYHDENYNPEQVDTECAWPVADPKLATGTLPAIEAARYVHVGRYEDLEHVYPVIMQWLAEHSYRALVPMREVYLNDPATTPREELITEVLIPVTK